MPVAYAQKDGLAIGIRCDLVRCGNHDIRGGVQVQIILLTDVMRIGKGKDNRSVEKECRMSQCSRADECRERCRCRRMNCWPSVVQVVCDDQGCRAFRSAARALKLQRLEMLSHPRKGHLHATA